MLPSSRTPEHIIARLDWHVIRRLDGLLGGEYRSLFRGVGVDLAGLREYQSGDDVRYIDWNVTARTTAPYIREYNEDREITVWFLLDLSPSVDFGTVGDGKLKRTVLIDLVATMARILTRRGNRIGAIIYGSGAPRAVPVGSGRVAVLGLIEQLLRQPMLEATSATDLGLLLDAGLRTMRRRSLAVVVSDFISAPGWERSLHLLNKRHELLAVRLVDPREQSLPDLGVVVLEDAETGEQMEIDTGDRAFRERFTAASEAREMAVARTLRRAGADAVTISTQDDLVRAIIRMAADRRRVRVHA